MIAIVHFFRNVHSEKCQHCTFLMLNADINLRFLLLPWELIFSVVKNTNGCLEPILSLGLIISDTLKPVKKDQLILFRFIWIIVQKGL